MNEALSRIVTAVLTPHGEMIPQILSEVNASSTQVGGSHYQAGYQHWDFMADLRPSWPEGCMSKYLTRVFKKNGLEDLEKVLHYCYKLMEQFYNGLVHPPLGTAQDRTAKYKRFVDSQKIDAPTHELSDMLMKCFSELSCWNDLRGLREVFMRVHKLHTAYSKYLDEQNYPKTEEPGSEPTRDYVDQDRSAHLASLVDTPTAKPQLNKAQVVQGVVRSSLAILPIAVHQTLLEMVRREKSADLNINVNPSHPQFCGDYSEPGLKIELAMQHLRESLPNKQSLRTAAALACLHDGVAALNSWAIYRDPELPDITRLLVHATALKGITSKSLSEYTSPAGNGSATS